MPIIKDSEIVAVDVKPDVDGVKPEDTKPAELADIDRLMRKDVADAAEVEIDGDVKVLSEPKVAAAKDAIYWTDDAGTEIVCCEIDDGSGRWSLVVSTATGRAHTWGAKDAILAAAKRIGLVS
jgi:hypothetical protein